jgi:hypothetical protein
MLSSGQGCFRLNNQLLILSNLPEDLLTIPLRCEQLRAFLERVLGDDLAVRAYRALSAGELSPAAWADLLGSERVQYGLLIEQLLMAESWLENTT